MQLKAGDVITTVGGMRAIPLGAMVRDEFGQHKWDAGYAGAFAESRREDDEPTGWSCTIVSLPTGYDEPEPLKVGDIVKTEADVRRIPDGAMLEWVEKNERWNSGAFPWKRSWELDPMKPSWAAMVLSNAAKVGLRILAFPGEPPPVAEKPGPRPAPRCKPGCSPAEPCRTKGVCPVWREPDGDVRGEGALWVLNRRGVPGDIPAAREMRRPPLRHEGIGGFGNWNGRAPK